MLYLKLYCALQRIFCANIIPFQPKRPATTPAESKTCPAVVTSAAPLGERILYATKFVDVSSIPPLSPTIPNPYLISDTGVWIGKRTYLLS